MPGLTVQHANLADPALPAPSTVSSPSAPPAGAALLGFAAGGQRWLVDPAPDMQVIDAAITPVPLARSWYLGLVLLGQRLIAAIDLAGIGGAEVGAPQSMERLLLLPERWQTALRVERVYGLLDVAALNASESCASASQAISAYPATDARLPWSGAKLADADGQRWQVLDVAQLCTSPAFLQAGIQPSA